MSNQTIQTNHDATTTRATRKRNKFKRRMKKIKKAVSRGRWRSKFDQRSSKRRNQRNVSNRSISKQPLMDKKGKGYDDPPSFSSVGSNVEECNQECSPVSKSPEQISYALSSEGEEENSSSYCTQSNNKDDADDDNNDNDDEGSQGSLGLDLVFENNPKVRIERRLSLEAFELESTRLIQSLQSETTTNNDDSTLLTTFDNSHNTGYNSSSMMMLQFDYSDNIRRILTHQQKMSDWLSSFYRTDPRFQIMKFFDDVAREGANTNKLSDYDEGQKEALTDISLIVNNPLLQMFARASVFTVWRPTSLIAIRKMMLGEATGKGLDIKGKSAKRGKLSGFVPFLQIHEEAHKRKVGTLHKDGRMRIFHKTRGAREKVVQILTSVSHKMMEEVIAAKRIMSKDLQYVPDDVLESAMETMLWDMKDPSIDRIDLYSPKCFGVEVPERLFWEGYVVHQDCTRRPSSEYDTGRPSEPAFQDMNFAAVRKCAYPDAPRAVVWQFNSEDDDENPMCPQTLLMAYEEKGRVLPVVSDFDAFVVGTRNVKYTEPLPPDQIELVHWCISQIETILDNQPKEEDEEENKSSQKSWTSQWLSVLKGESKQKGSSVHHHKTPRFGYGDPKSYSIFEHAIKRLEESNGAVRHGAECFNFIFPQELDEEFLVISDTLPGNVPWQYVNMTELQDILCQKIREGFTFPLNPKWILCDEGWKRVYDQLLKSPSRNVQDSLACWYPPESGLMERIEKIHARHPDGFKYLMNRDDSSKSLFSVGSRADDMDLAQHELHRHLALMRAKRKLRNVLFWVHFYQSQKAKRLKQQEEERRKQQEEEQEDESFKTDSENSLMVQDETSTNEETENRQVLTAIHTPSKEEEQKEQQIQEEDSGKRGSKSLLVVTDDTNTSKKTEDTNALFIPVQ